MILNITFITHILIKLFLVIIIRIFQSQFINKISTQVQNDTLLFIILLLALHIESNQKHYHRLLKPI